MGKEQAAQRERYVNNNTTTVNQDTFSKLSVSIQSSGEANIQGNYGEVPSKFNAYKGQPKGHT